MLELITFPDNRLRVKCEDVKSVNAEFKGWVYDMMFLCNVHRGLGISAPQVGLAYNFFMWKFNPSIIINPIVTKRKGIPEAIPEGCLSIPNLIVHVPRRPEIEVEFFDIKGKEYKMTLKKEQARIFLHEWDHLQGRLIIDYE